MMTEVLLLDGDVDLTAATSDAIRHAGFSVRIANSMQAARDELIQKVPQILIMDWLLPDGSGLDLLDRLDCPDIRTVVVTDHPSVESAIESLRKRVSDYLIKPVDLSRLIACMRRLAPVKRPVVRVERHHEVNARGVADLGILVGQTPVMRRLYGLLGKVASTEATVMLYGESGTGKELAARAIHELSGVKGPFLAINCAAVPKELIANELFGHEKGGFTGAIGQHRGYFERAERGTLLLDEITEMPLELQAYLLRVLETRKVLRVGSSQEINVDVRLVAATNQPLEAAVQDRKLREDLYYRLMVFPIRLPSLRERKPDIPLLAEHFIATFNREHGTAKTLESGAHDVLIRHHWPGNVRELRNCVHRAFLIAGDRIGDSELNAALDLSLEITGPGHGQLRLSTGTSLKEAERQLIMVTLEQFQGNKRLAAKSLGVSLKTLYNKLKCYEVVFDSL
jgi:two-component system response regulator AtoC